MNKLDLAEMLSAKEGSRALLSRLRNRCRAIRKKLHQIDELRSRESAGQRLDSGQQAKLAQELALRAGLESLQVCMTRLWRLT